MMIEIHPEALDGVIRAWLKDTLETLQFNSSRDYVHPDDAKQYKKDIKAVKRLIDYIGGAA